MFLFESTGLGISELFHSVQIARATQDEDMNNNVGQRKGKKIVREIWLGRE